MSLHVDLTRPVIAPVASVVVVLAEQTTTTIALVAIVSDAQGNQLLGRVVTWSSSDSTIAPVNALGVVTEGSSNGTATITATCEEVTGSMTVTITGATPVVTTVTVSPSSASITDTGAGDTVQLSATVTDQYGATMTGQTIAWSSTAPSTASVDSNSGLVTGQAAGSATISATCAGVTGTAAITVTHPASVATTVTVSPSSFSVAAGSTTQLAATTKDQYNATMTGRTYSWTSSDTSIATVDSSGLVTGVAAGSVTITAHDGSVTGSSAVTLTAAGGGYTPAATTVVVSTASTFQCNVGSTRQLIATTYDQMGAAMTGRTYSWTSSDPSYATVTSAGLVTGVKANDTSTSLGGSIRMTATDTGAALTASVNVTVGFQAAMAIGVSTSAYGYGLAMATPCPFVQLAVGGTRQLYVMTYDLWQTPMPQNTAYTWSSDSSFVSANGSGLVTGSGNGAAIITVSDNLVPQVSGVANVGVGTYAWLTTIAAAPGANIQLAVTDNGTDITNNAGTGYSSSNTTVATIGTSAPTLTGAPTPSSITAGTGPITMTFPCTNPHVSQTLGGLPSGVTAGAATVVDSTHISFPVTAASNATIGTANVFLLDPAQGPSGTEPLTVASGSSPTIVQHVQAQSPTGIDSSVTATLGVAPTAGNLLLALVGYDNAGRSVVASGWTRKDGASTGTDTGFDIWTKVAGTGESASQLFQYSGSPSEMCVVMYEISGCANAAAPFQGYQFSAPLLSQGTSVTTPALAAGAVNALPIGTFVSNANPVTTVSTSGWTGDELARDGFGQGVYAAHQTTRTTDTTTTHSCTFAIDRASDMLAATIFIG